MIMAFQKTFTVRSGAQGDYTRLISYRVDRITREAVGLFAVFLNSAAAHSGKEPLTPWIAKLRVEGDIFDQYFSRAAIDSDVLANFYRAAKAEPMISDFGEDLFHDAQDV
jgi:ClpP class serine protease